MTHRDRLPELPPSALRDHAAGSAGEARVARVWRRLEGELGEGSQVRANRRSRRAPDWVLWAPAAAIVLFASGVIVGRATPRPAGPEVVVEQERVSRSEPAANVEPVPEVEPEPGERTEPRPGRLSRASEPVRDGEPAEAEPEAPAVAEPLAVTPPAEPPEWYRLWNEDEYQKAREAIERQGGFDAALELAPPDQAMAMVDLARFSRENALAIAALRRVVERYPNDPNAPIAALTLGNMLERAGDTKGAAQAFQAYRALSPGGDFAEDALARQIEAAVEQRDVTRALELMTQYEEEFPAGSRLEELRAQLREAEQGSAEASPAEADASAEPAPPAEPMAPPPTPSSPQRSEAHE